MLSRSAFVADSISPNSINRFGADSVKYLADAIGIIFRGRLTSRFCVNKLRRRPFQIREYLEVHLPLTSL